MPRERTGHKPWTLAEGVELVQALEPLVRPLHYHSMLGGGVLHHGSSQKDLDLFFMPLNGSPSRPQEVVALLDDMFDSEGESLINEANAKRYAADEPALCWYTKMLFYVVKGKRIDVFIQ